MGALDFPLLRVEVVGSVADVLHPTDGDVLVCDEYISFGCVRWERDGFLAKILDSFFVGKFYSWEFFLVDFR